MKRNNSTKEKSTLKTEQSNYCSILNSITEETKTLLSYSPEKQRYLWYTNQTNKNQIWLTVNYFENEDILVFAENVFELRMGNHLFPSGKSRKGLTLDKKTKKLSLWYGSKPGDLRYLHELLRRIGKEWVVNEGFLGGDRTLEVRKPNEQGVIVKQIVNLAGWMTKGLLEKILTDKITNPTQACQYIIKSNRWKGLIPSDLKKYIKEGIGYKQHVSVFYPILVNPNDVFQKEFIRQTQRSHELVDIINQAKALSRKIDFGWSERRLNEVHTEWTRELMRMEIEMMEEEIVDYPPLPTLPQGFELLTSKKRVFEEGTIMGHCVYTNYWDRIRGKRYFVLHVTDDEGNVATAGLTFRLRVSLTGQTNGLVIDQIKSKYNREPSQKIKEMVEKFVNEPGIVEWFSNIEQSKDKELEYELPY